MMRMTKEPMTMTPKGEYLAIDMSLEYLFNPCQHFLTSPRIDTPSAHYEDFYIDKSHLRV